MIANIGERVGAILSADSTTVKLLGFGVYDGDFEPPDPPFGLSREAWDELSMEVSGELVPPPKNPRITLDSGRIVWGQQCWWGPEEEVRAAFGGRRVELWEIIDGEPVFVEQVVDLES